MLVRLLLTVWVWCRLYNVHKPHIRDVVNVDLYFEDDDEGFPVHLHGKNGGGEEEFTDHGLSLIEAA